MACSVSLKNEEKKKTNFHKKSNGLQPRWVLLLSAKNRKLSLQFSPKLDKRKLITIWRKRKNGIKQHESMDPSCLVSAVKFVPNEVAKQCITFSCSQFTLQVWRKLELKLPNYFQVCQGVCKKTACK
uniref:Uncharacterized protein n=1 Tax=Oreochromis aureus TaxID=47969 RepID=A0AAZ1X4I3_OREAU